MNIKLSTITYVIVLISCPVWRTARVICVCIVSRGVVFRGLLVAPVPSWVECALGSPWSSVSGAPNPRPAESFTSPLTLGGPSPLTQTACSHGPLGNGDHVCPRPRIWTTLHHYSLPEIQIIRPQREARGFGATTAPSDSQGTCQQREQSL